MDGRRRIAFGSGTARQDWTPAVLMTAGFAVLMAAVVWFVRPFAGGGAEPGPERPLRVAPAEVDVFVGPLGPDFVGILSPVLRDPEPDSEHEAHLERRLGFAVGKGYGWARLVAFNRGSQPATLQLADGWMRVLDGSGSVVESRSLAGAVRDGEVVLPDDLEFTLRVLGALEETVEVPPHQGVQLFVPLARRGALVGAQRIEVAAGQTLEPRRISQAGFQRLLLQRDEAALEDLLR